MAERQKGISNVYKQQRACIWGNFFKTLKINERKMENTIGNKCAKELNRVFSNGQ